MLQMPYLCNVFPTRRQAGGAATKGQGGQKCRCGGVHTLYGGKDKCDALHSFLENIHITMSTKIPRSLYSVDWLQVFCLRPLGNSMEWKEKVSRRSDKNGIHRRYKLAGAKQFIQGYEQQRTIIYNNYTIATVAWSPADKRRRAEGCAVKMANPTLYCADWYFLLMDVLAVLDWTPHNLTRCDLAVDLNYFVGGILPSTFMRKYVCKNNCSYIRHGSNKWALYGRKEMRATVFDSIRWGSRSSGVSVYLYNKSKELREVHDKPWIREAWKKAELSSTLDVWRVEISITSQGLGLKSLANGMLHTLFIDDISKPEYVQEIFLTFASHYFKFFNLDPTAKRKRDLKEVQFLPRPKDPAYKPASLYEYVNSGRTERVVSNKLFDVVEYLQDRDFAGKYDTIEAIKKAEAIFNEMYRIKSRCHQAETVILQAMVKGTLGGYGATRSEEWLEKCRWARKHIEEMTQIVREQAKEVLHTSLDVP